MSEYDWLSVPLGQSEEVEDDIIQLYSLGMNYANNHSLRKDLSLTLGSPLAVSLPSANWIINCPVRAHLKPKLTQLLTADDQLWAEVGLISIL